MGLSEFQGGVVGALNAQDQNNQDLLSQVITAASAVSNDSTAADVTAAGVATEVSDVARGFGSGAYDADLDHRIETLEAEQRGVANNSGYIRWGGQNASLQGTGGVALLEYAKDAIQTAVSNISGVGTNQITTRKLVERKLNSLG